MAQAINKGANQIVAFKPHPTLPRREAYVPAGSLAEDPV